MSVPDHSPEKPEKPNLLKSGFWETYIIRYFVGSVVGAFICMCLYRHNRWDEKLPLRLPMDSELNYTTVVLFGIIGLAYCYVATAPILTIHALRGQFPFGEVTKVKRLVYWVSIVGTTAITDKFMAYYTLRPMLSLDPLSVSALTVSAIISIQFVMFVAASGNKFERIKIFYAQVTAARASKSAAVKEYVESYRVLREHGNAFFTLAMELCLAGVLFVVPGRRFQVFFLIMWCAPSFFAMIVAMALESYLPEFAGKHTK